MAFSQQYRFFSCWIRNCIDPHAACATRVTPHVLAREPKNDQVYQQLRYWEAVRAPIPEKRPPKGPLVAPERPQRGPERPVPPERPQRDPERPIQAQRSSERPREAERGQNKPVLRLTGWLGGWLAGWRKAQRLRRPERPKEAHRSLERPREAQRAPERLR